MPHSDNAVSLLNELIRVSEDGEKGFRTAAEQVDDPGLKSLFQDRAKACHGAATELQSLVRKLGGEPEDSGSLAGAAHRGWVRAKAAIGDTNVAVLEEVERGEDVAKAVYARAMKADLPTEVRSVLERHYQGVLRNHDRIRDLRNQYRASATT